jgi:hypothetical protein
LLTEHGVGCDGCGGLFWSATATANRNSKIETIAERIVTVTATVRPARKNLQAFSACGDLNKDSLQHSRRCLRYRWTPNLTLSSYWPVSAPLQRVGYRHILIKNSTACRCPAALRGASDRRISSQIRSSRHSGNSVRCVRSATSPGLSFCADRGARKQHGALNAPISGTHLVIVNAIRPAGAPGSRGLKKRLATVCRSCRPWAQIPA